jgi:hypothetical protein
MKPKGYKGLSKDEQANLDRAVYRWATEGGEAGPGVAPEVTAKVLAAAHNSLRRQIIDRGILDTAANNGWASMDNDTLLVRLKTTPCYEVTPECRLGVGTRLNKEGVCIAFESAELRMWFTKEEREILGESIPDIEEVIEDVARADTDRKYAITEFVGSLGAWALENDSRDVFFNFVSHSVTDQGLFTKIMGSQKARQVIMDHCSEVSHCEIDKLLNLHQVFSTEGEEPKAEEYD